MKTKLELRIIEMVILLIIGITTVIIQPPIPLLAIPFLLIITLRAIMVKLEDEIK